MANAVLPGLSDRVEPVELDGDADLVGRYLAALARLRTRPLSAWSG
jgi:hypothetical protein